MIYIVTSEPIAFHDITLNSTTIEYASLNKKLTVNFFKKLYNKLKKLYRVYSDSINQFVVFSTNYIYIYKLIEIEENVQLNDKLTKIKK